MLGAALLWGVVRHRVWRAIVLVTAALAVAMLTPIVRETTMFDWLPDPIEAYASRSLRIPVLLAALGGIRPGGAGCWAMARRGAQPERRAASHGVASAPRTLARRLRLRAVAAAAALSAHSNFWTSSPTFSAEGGRSGQPRSDCLCLDGAGPRRPISDSGARSPRCSFTGSTWRWFTPSDLANPSTTHVRAGARRVRRVCGGPPRAR